MIYSSGSMQNFGLIERCVSCGTSLWFADGLGGILYDALWEAGGGHLEVLDDVCGLGASELVG